MHRLLFVLIVIGVCPLIASGRASAQDLTADDYIEFWRPMVGVWQGTFEADGQAQPITFRMRIARNQKCFLIYDESEGVPGTQQLQAYDPVTKKEIAWGVDGEGNRQIQTIMIDGIEKGKKVAPGVGGSWEVKVFRNDGKTITTTCNWKYTRFDESHSTLVWSNVKEDGVAKPDITLTLERQSRGRSRAQE